MRAGLSVADKVGNFKARCGIGRMRYSVQPGLYAVGNPGPASMVMVTANYKMSFDRLRNVLDQRDSWILVLDTHGINVWCAAGKGTFGTKELVRRVESSGLSALVGHRKLIVPQLGASGVSAWDVRKLSGWEVCFGPVRAEDLPAFIQAGLKADPAMRRKTFSLADRLVLIPVELMCSIKIAVIALFCFALLGGMIGPGPFLQHFLELLTSVAGGFGLSLLSGCAITPALLPWLPGKSFSLKGLFPGILCGFGYAMLGWDSINIGPTLEAVAWMLAIPAISSHLALNFTGASTYTSLSGVKKEMRWAIPLQIVMAVTGSCVWILSQLYR